MTDPTKDPTPRLKNDPGHGPPPGSSGDYRGAPSIPLDTLVQRQVGGTVMVPTDDAAFQPPTDPLGKGTGSKTRLVYRDIPIVTIQNSWAVDEVRAALRTHMSGQFDASGQLCDAILGDPRVAATLGSRVSGLFSRDVSFRPADDSQAAKEVCDAWSAHWPALFGDSAFVWMFVYSILMGFSPSQLVWDTASDPWLPYMRPWNTRFSYYHPTVRRYIAMSQDGQIAIEPGDGKWVLHAPYGDYRGWVRGAIRPIAEPWLLRHFAARDMARFSEVHGLPTRIGETPMAADPVERSKFEDDLARLGSEATLLIGKGVDKEHSYDFRLVEATDSAWEVFPGQQDRCDMDIVLAIMFQNLTTEVKGGSFAATSSHMDVKQTNTQFDGGAWKNTVYRQIARPFAYLNYGDANLAPWTEWDVAPREDYEHKAKQFQAFGTAIEVLRRGGVEFKDPAALRAFARSAFGIEGMPEFTITAPVASSGGGGG